jgi:dihydroorotate dehydrogenase (fumarate)
MLTAAGAHAIELNASLVTPDPARSAAELEDAYVDLVRSVADGATVPIAVKLPPFLTAPAHLAPRLEAAGARGLVLFARPPEPDIDLVHLETSARIERSSPAELGLRLRWLALLRPRVGCSLAATGGVWSGRDAAKAILAGADVAMVASVLLQRGVGELERLETDLADALRDADLASVDGARGLLALPLDRAAETERTAYLRALVDAGARR